MENYVSKRILSVIKKFTESWKQTKAFAVIPSEPVSAPIRYLTSKKIPGCTC